MSKKVKFSLFNMVMNLIPTGFVVREISKTTSGFLIKQQAEIWLKKKISETEIKLEESKKRGQKFLLLVVAVSALSFSLNHFKLFPQFPYLPFAHYFLWSLTLIPLIFYPIYALFFKALPEYNKEYKEKYERDAIDGIRQFHKKPIYSYHQVKGFINSSNSYKDRDNLFIITTVGALVNIGYHFYKKTWKDVSNVVGVVQSIGFLHDDEKLIADNCGQVYDTVHHIFKAGFRTLLIMLFSAVMSTLVKQGLAWQFDFLPYWRYLAGFGVVVILVLWNMKQRALGRLICGMCTYRWR